MEAIMTAEQVQRHLDTAGYLQFRYWRLYSAEGLAGHTAEVRLYHQTLTVLYQESPLTQYHVTYAGDEQRIDTLDLLREWPDHYPSLQMHLWEMGHVEWHKALRVPHRRPRQKRGASVKQLALFPVSPPARQRRTSSSTEVSADGH